jgi:hypothetical protein
LQEFVKELLNLCLDFSPKRQFITVHLLKPLASDAAAEV